MFSLLVSLALLVSGSADPPGLCTCVGEKTLSEQIAEADLIFEGIALEKHGYPVDKLRRFDNETPRQFGLGSEEYVLFFATKVWKGTRMQGLVVATASQSSMCGYLFEEGRRYLVYAYIEEAQPMTSLCTLTKPADEAEKDRAKLSAAFKN